MAHKGTKPWNIGFTKATHPSVMKISTTLASKQKSNFWFWQQEHKPTYASLQFSNDLAELYGTLLGDGCLEKLPRTEKLTISFNRKEQDHIRHVAMLLMRVFGKKPSLRVRSSSQCDDLYLYQNFLSARLNFPTGEKLQHELFIPERIAENREYLRLCLKGLFETDGCLCINESNYTHVLEFSNRSKTLLKSIGECLLDLGYRPHYRRYAVCLARKAEAIRFAEWIRFRRYPISIQRAKICSLVA